MNKNSLRRLAVGSAACATMYGIIALYLSATQVEKVFLPRADMPSVPSRMGMRYENLVISPSRNGVAASYQLHAFWVPADNADAPIVLYLHGQDATRGKNLEQVESFHECGYSVLILDYRGYAESFGQELPSESKVYEDASDALHYLKTKYPSHPLFIYGHSLGGAVAIDLATKIAENDAAGLIVESTFTSMLEMSTLQYGGFLRLFPVDFLLTERFDSLSKINLVKCPIHCIHGKADSKVPFEMSIKLCAKAGETATLHLVDGAAHEDCCLIDKVEYRKRIDEFVSKCLHKVGETAAQRSSNNGDL